MKIKKVLLYNFKNFKYKTIIDFDEDITFLVGPNGFGKTTIFDAIEIGLTGNLYRVISKDKVTPENIKYNKPFFQNEISKPVIIKLWLYKDNGEQLVVVRKFESEESNSKKAYAPMQSISQFKLFKHNEISDSIFGNVHDSKILTEISQNKIDSFLGLSGKYEIKNIFNLFNYIQQEETTFFLKQSEQKRSDSLSFLIKTDEIENKIERINKVSRVIKDTIKKYEIQKNDLKQQEMGEILYKRLFNHSKFLFDQLEPYSEKNLCQLEEDKRVVQNIIDFKQNFSVSEYKKNLEKDSRIRDIDNNVEINLILYFLLLSRFIQRPNHLWEREKYALMHSDLLESLLLEKYILEYNRVSYTFKRRKQLNNYLDKLSSNFTDMSKYIFNYSKEDCLADDFSSIQNKLEEYQKRKESASQIEKELSDLLSLRKNLGNKFYGLSQHKHLSDVNCPFCNSCFESFEKLKKSYDSYQVYLESISSTSSLTLQEIQTEINESVNKVKNKIEYELRDLKIDVDERLLEKLQELNIKYREHGSNINGFRQFIQSYINIVPYQLGRLSFDEFNKQYILKQQEYRSKLMVDEEVYGLLDHDKLDEIEKKYNKFKSKYPNFDFSSFQLGHNISQKINKNIINVELENIKKQLKIWINQNFPVREDMIVDNNRVLSEYFNDDIELLEKINISDLKQKKLYIERQASLIKNQQFEEILKKISVLDKTKKNLELISKLYEDEVKKFKINIIKQLRIPFFVYSAKMLQNYQQGLGIFLTYKEANKNGDDQAVVKFKSDPNNDHDAIHQLSTGQLAVVSLAFTLSLNTMFQLSEHLKFLMIDDPIQDMDAMNVLSFVEILRHGIIGEYQVVLSTYSDLNAVFMGYKFVNSNSQVNVEYKYVRELCLANGE